MLSKSKALNSDEATGAIKSGHPTIAYALDVSGTGYDHPGFGNRSYLEKRNSSRSLIPAAMEAHQKP